MQFNLFFSMTYLTKNDQWEYYLESNVSFEPCWGKVYISQMSAFRRSKAEIEMHMKCHWLTWRFCRIGSSFKYNGDRRGKSN